MILMSSRRNASAPIIHEHVKLFDHLTGRDISKTTCVESMLVGNHLSDELNCKVKEFIAQLENRERELFSKNELDQAKFCQLSRKYFINFVELIGGGGGIPVGNRKDPPLSSVQANTTIVLLDTSASSTESTILKNG